MKITFLGTAAAEGFPAVFCNCIYCQKARKLGGKNIRTRSQALINDDLLIDLPADTYHHFLQNGIEGDKIEYLLVTHSHGDHFYPKELTMRAKPYAHDMRAPELKMYCGTGVEKKFLSLEKIPKNLSVEVLKPFQKVSFGEYTVTALPAKHFIGDDALFYIIESEKRILYAHDTGYFYEEVFAYIKEQNIRFDLITLDCTKGNDDVPDEHRHMGIGNNKRIVARLKEMGAVDEKTKVFVNHFSHNSAPFQEDLEKQLEADGYFVAYDGCVMEI